MWAACHLAHHSQFYMHGSERACRTAGFVVLESEYSGWGRNGSTLGQRTIISNIFYDNVTMHASYPQAAYIYIHAREDVYEIVGVEYREGNGELVRL